MPHSKAKEGDDRNRTGGAFRSSVTHAKPPVCRENEPEPAWTWLIWLDDKEAA
jgi:hypothetical protein